MTIEAISDLRGDVGQKECLIHGILEEEYSAESL